MRLAAIQSGAFLGDVSALCLLSDGSLLIGSGSYVTRHSSDISSTIAISVRQRFGNGGDRVHGIYRFDTLTVVFGMNRCEIWMNQTMEVVGVIADLPQCVLDVAFIDREQLAIGLAHNIVHIYKVINGVWTLDREYHCQDQSLLYSMSLIITPDTFTVAAGTVFNQIIIWQVPDIADSAAVPVISRLVGHSGVVFSLSWNVDGTMICSTSDDRTVRIWSLNDGKCVGVGYGHVSRVWRARFLGDIIVTAGEDGTLRKWSIDGRLLESLSGHCGNVWAIDADTKRGVIVSGGEDADIRYWRLEPIVLNRITSRIPSWLAQYDRAIVALYDRNSAQSTVVVLRCGIVAEVTVDDIWRIHCSVTCVDVRDSAMLPGQAVLALAVRKSSNPLIPDGLVLVDLTTQPLHDLQYSNLRSTDTVFPLKGVFKVWTAGGFIFAFDGVSLHYLSCHGPTPPGMGSTCSTVGAASGLSSFETNRSNISAIAVVSDFVVTGDTDGVLTLYQFGISGSLFRVVGAHGRSTIRDAVPFDNGVFSLGADGTIQQYRIGPMNLVRIGVWSSPNPLAERIIIGDSVSNLPTPNLFTAGFNGASNQYIVSDVRSRAIFAAFPHSGPRTATCLSIKCPISEGFPSGATFRFVSPVKDVDGPAVVTLSLPGSLSPLGSTRHPFHTRDIAAVMWLPGLPLMACTVGEDGSFRVVRVDGDNQPECIAMAESCNGRNSQRCMALVQSSGSTFVFSGGAKLQLLCYYINTSYFPPMLTPAGSLSGAAFAGYRCGKWFNKPKSDLDAERQLVMDIRIMSMVALPSTDGESIMVICGTSTGGLVSHIYDIASQRFLAQSSLRSDVSHGYHPILSLSCCQADRVDTFLIVSADTRGHILLWSCHLPNSSLQIISRFTATHQSGINALTIRYDNGRVTIASGGDDHGLHFITFPYHHKSVGNVQRYMVASAHFATVTGIWLIFHGGRFVAFSTGSDRRVRGWVCSELPDYSWNCIGSHRVGCASIHDMDVVVSDDGSYHIVVCGQGIEYIAFSSKFLFKSVS